MKSCLVCARWSLYWWIDIALCGKQHGLSSTFFLGKTRWIFFPAPRLRNRCMILHQNPLLYRYGTCNYGLGYLLPWFVSSYYTTCSFSRQSDDNFIRKQIYGYYEFIDESNRWVGAFLDRCIERLICLSQRYNVVNRLHLKGSHFY